MGKDTEIGQIEGNNTSTIGKRKLTIIQNNPPQIAKLCVSMLCYLWEGLGEAVVNLRKTTIFYRQANHHCGKGQMGVYL